MGEKGNAKTAAKKSNADAAPKRVVPGGGISPAAVVVASLLASAEPPRFDVPAERGCCTFSHCALNSKGRKKARERANLALAALPPPFVAISGECGRSIDRVAACFLPTLGCNLYVAQCEDRMPVVCMKQRWYLGLGAECDYSKVCWTACCGEKLYNTPPELREAVLTGMASSALPTCPSTTAAVHLPPIAGRAAGPSAELEVDTESA